MAIGGPDTTIRAPVEISYTAEEYPALSLPEAFAASYEQAEAAELYRVNCMVCHGESLRGDGVMASKLLTAGGSAAPANDESISPPQDNALYRVQAGWATSARCRHARERECSSDERTWVTFRRLNKAPRIK